MSVLDFRILQARQVLAAADRASGWKILLYDRNTQAAIAQCVSWNLLAERQVTLHRLIDAAREALPEVPAVYIVRPTEDNIRRIAADINASMYAAFYLHFDPTIPRHLMEMLAMLTAQNSSRVSCVIDQYTDFIALEPDLLSFNIERSYARLNAPGIDEQKMITLAEPIVEHLFSVSVTMQAVPIIKAETNTVAELVARKLEERLRTHISGRNNLFTSTQILSRPLLILVDRNSNITAPVLHPWTYQAMLNDLLGMTANRVTITIGKKPYTYDMNSEDDKFWMKHAGKSFPEVAEAIARKNAEYQAKVNELKGHNNDDNMTSHLSSAISNLPKMQKKKRLVDMHMNIATALLHQVKHRNIDTFFETESWFIAHDSRGDRNAMMKLLNPEITHGTIVDRIRAAILFYLTSPAASDQMMKEIGPMIIGSDSEDSNAKELLGSLDFLRTYRFTHKLNTESASQPMFSQPAKPKLGGVFDKIASTVVGQASGLLAGVKQLMPANTDLPITRIVEAVVFDDHERYMTWDPRSRNKGAFRPPPAQHVSHRDIIICMVGGGSYVEYQNLKDWAARNLDKGVNGLVYSATEIVSPDQFVQQLVELGNASQKNTLPVD